MQIPNELKPYYGNITFERDDVKMIINLDPQHLSAYENLCLILELDGEQVIRAHPCIGYMHRSIEKMTENMIYQEFIPTTDRTDYIAASANNYACRAAVEKLCGLEIPRHATMVRMILLELNHVASHLLWLATHTLGVGAVSVFLYCFRGREYVLDLIERYCGVRLTHSSVRIGEVMLDLPSGFLDELLAFYAKFPNDVKDYGALLDGSRIWRLRTENVRLVTKEQAMNWGCSGVMLRGSGVCYSIRKGEPYLLYDGMDFGVPYATQGDFYAKYEVYTQEFRESLKILTQCVKLHEDTPPEILASHPEYVNASKEQAMTQNYSLIQHFVLVMQGLKPPKGEVYMPTESPRGELGFLIHSDGTSRPYHLKARTSSFWHCAFFEEMLVGSYLADVVAIMGNVNIVLSEIDRRDGWIWGVTRVFLQI